MKRISALLLCLLLALSFTACGKKDKAPDNAPISGIEPAAADKSKKKPKRLPSLTHQTAPLKPTAKR